MVTRAFDSIFNLKENCHNLKIGTDPFSVKYRMNCNGLLVPKKFSLSARSQVFNKN